MNDSELQEIKDEIENMKKQLQDLERTVEDLITHIREKERIETEALRSVIINLQMLQEFLQKK